MTELQIDNTVRRAQDKIDAAQEEHGNDYSADGMKDVIVDWLDEIYIEPPYIDEIMAQLDF